MSSGRKRFKILTHVEVTGTWPSSLRVPRKYQCPGYRVFAWCQKRKKFRYKDILAVGVPYAWNDSHYGRRGGYMNDINEFGQRLADQNGLPWISRFDPSWKLHDLMLMRLKGKV